MEFDDVEVKVIVVGCCVPSSLDEDVSTILVTWKSEVGDDDDEVVAAAAAASLVEGLGDATTSEEDCDVVDVEVPVVSTMTALVEVAGIGAAAGAVDKTTGVLGLTITGEGT